MNPCEFIDTAATAYYIRSRVGRGVEVIFSQAPNMTVRVVIRQGAVVVEACMAPSLTARDARTQIDDLCDRFVLNTDPYGVKNRV